MKPDLLTDTAEHRTYDKRTPRLFKEEWRGDGMIGLNSKTYYCFVEKDKFSCKLVNKRLNGVDKEKYLVVLLTRRTGSGVNQGYLFWALNKVFTLTLRYGMASRFSIRNRKSWRMV